MPPSGENQPDERNIGDDKYRQLVNEPTSQGIENQDDGAGALNKREKEAASSENNSGNLRDQESNSAPPIRSTYGQAKKVVKGTMSLKKKSGIAGVIVFLLGMVGIGGGLLTPGIGLVQLKEVFTTDLNDQLAAMDIRGNHVFRARLQGMSKGVCTGVQIKCRFTSMNKKQVELFKKNGFTIADEDIQNKPFGRQVITKMIAPDGTEIKNPADLTRARANNVEVRRAMNRVFSPLYYSLSDKVANTFLAEKGTDKRKKITGSTDEERKEGLKEETSGSKKTSGAGVMVDETGRYITDENGNKVYENDEKTADRFKELQEKAAANSQKLSGGGGKLTGKVIAGVGMGVSILGAADTLCTVYNVSRGIQAAAKMERAQQLIQYAMVINSAADSIKAGDAKPDEINFVMNKITAVDNREQIMSPNGLIANPMYKKSGFDSPGYKTASYNEAPNLTPQSQQYMIGGGTTGELQSFIDSVQEKIGGNPRQTCGIIQSPWVRGAGLVVGVLASIGSVGLTTIAGVAASSVISFALPFLQATLGDIIAGEVVGGDIAGVDSVDAYFAGSGALLGGIAMKRGLAPASKGKLKNYIAATAESRSELIALQKEDALKTPFDAMNQYTFTGTLVRSLYPTSLSIQANASSALMSVGSILSLGFKGLFQSAHAQETFNDLRYSKCVDSGYKEVGIDADIFCNPRYALTTEELSMDTETVVDYMYAKDYIASDGQAKGLYKEFLEKCVNREDGWGEASEEGGSIGLECIDDHAETYADISYFRVFTIDSSINTAMDGDTAVGTGASENPTTNTGRPPEGVDKKLGWSLAPNTGVDVSNYPCDSRTPVFMEKYTSPRFDYSMKLCMISFNTNTNANANGSKSVNALISTNLMNMFEAARADGVELGLEDGMRLDGGSTRYYSEHATGLAFDLKTATTGTICFNGNSASGYGTKDRAEAACKAKGGKEYEAYTWLNNNASKFGFYNFDPEPWHWSTSGA
jgi:hypothetical protein